jgi:hypothetical protein
LTCKPDPRPSSGLPRPKPIPVPQPALGGDEPRHEAPPGLGGGRLRRSAWRPANTRQCRLAILFILCPLLRCTGGCWWRRRTLVSRRWSGSAGRANSRRAGVWGWRAWNLHSINSQVVHIHGTVLVPVLQQQRHCFFLHSGMVPRPCRTVSFTPALTPAGRRDHSPDGTTQTVSGNQLGQGSSHNKQQHPELAHSQLQPLGLESWDLVMPD